MRTFESHETAFLDGLTELLEQRTPVSQETPLTDQNWNSIAVLSAIALIDKTFDITIESDLLLSCESVGQLSDLVRRRLEEGAR